MNKTIFAVMLATAACCAQAGEHLTIAYYTALPLPVVPVAVAAERDPNVQFVAVDGPGMQAAMLSGTADCGVVPVRDAVALYEQSGHKLLIDSGLMLDKAQDRELQRSVLVCGKAAEAKPAFEALSVSLFSTLGKLRMGGGDEKTAADIAKRVVKRTGMSGDAGALAERIATPANAGNGVAYILAPRDIKFAADAEQISIGNVNDALSSGLKAQLKKTKQSAI